MVSPALLSGTPGPPRVLVLAAGDGDGREIRDVLERAGCSVVERYPGGPELADSVVAAEPALVVLDLTDETDARRALARAIRHGSEPRPRVLGIVDPARPASIAAALEPAICDSIVRPFGSATLLARVQMSLQLHALDVDRHDRLKELLVLEAIGELVGSNDGLDQALRRVAAQLLKLSGTDFAAICLDDPARLTNRPGLAGGGGGDPLLAPTTVVKPEPAEHLDVRLLLRDRRGARPTDDGLRRASDLPTPARAVAGALGLGLIARQPLVASGRTVGTLIVGRSSVEPYTRRQIARLHHVAGLVGPLVERRLVLADIARRMERLSRLQQLIQLVTTTFDAEPILRAAIDGAGDLIGANAVRIWLHESDGETLRLLAASDPGPEVDRIAIEDSLPGSVLRAGGPSRSLRSSASGAKRQRAPGGFEQHAAWLGVPFAGAEDQATGVMVALRTDSSGFTDDEVDVLMALGTAIGLALKTIRLYEAASSAEQDLRDAASLTAMGMLTSSIVHDFAQPITAAIARLEVLAAEEILSPHGVESLRRIKRSLQRVGETATHLRRLARRTPPTFQLVDVHQVLDDALSLVEHELELGNIDVVKRFEPDLPEAWGNPDSLERVFVNLLTNARDAMEGRTGAVTLITRRAASEPNTGWVEVIVEDEGDGLPADVASRLYQPLTTTKEPGRGVGLGLSICQRIVEQHGGRIETSNPAKRGARFHVFLRREPPTGSARSGRRGRSRPERTPRDREL